MSNNIINLNFIDPSQITGLTTSLGDLISGNSSGTLTITSVGTDGQVLTADSGQTGGIGWATLSSGPANSVITYTSSDTFIVPSGVTSIECIGQAGGGGGGGGGGVPDSGSFPGGGGGGGSGEFAIQRQTVSPGETITITISAGGSGGSGGPEGNGTVRSNGTDGTAGSNVTVTGSVTGSILSLTGGNGGGGGQGSLLFSSGDGGNGGDGVFGGGGAFAFEGVPGTGGTGVFEDGTLGNAAPALQFANYGGGTSTSILGYEGGGGAGVTNPNDGSAGQGGLSVPSSSNVNATLPGAGGGGGRGADPADFGNFAGGNGGNGGIAYVTIIY